MKLASSLSSGFLGVGEEWPTLVFLWHAFHDETIAAQAAWVRCHFPDSLPFVSPKRYKRSYPCWWVTPSATPCSA